MKQPLTDNTEQDIMHETVDLLNVILTGWEFYTCLDKIIGTPLYNGKLKTMINNFLPALEKIANKSDDIWGVKDDTLYTLLEDRKELMKQIATFRPEYKNGFGELLKMFKEMPEVVLHRNGIKIYD